MPKISLLGKTQIDPAVRVAFDVAFDNIYAFHAAQRIPEMNIENMNVIILFCLY